MFRFLFQISKYKITYRNWVKVVIFVLLKRNVKGRMRDGTLIPTTFLTIQVKELMVHGAEPKYDEYEDKITFYYDGKTVSLKGASKNGDICGVYLYEEYKYLEVNGKYVIDIGMNIGDSSIYFAIKGAEKVIAFEPFKKVFMIAKDNIDRMKLSNKIFPVNAGIGSGNSSIRISDLSETTDISLEEDETGLDIPIYSLDNIIEQCPSFEIMLKMDCEGCEYQAFKTIKMENFAKIKRIVMEYHHGYESLKSLLEKNGFKCSVTKPYKSKNRQNYVFNIGYLYAERLK